MAGTRWWKTGWKRIVLLVVLTFAGLWVLALLAGHFMLWYEARQVCLDHPVASLMPTELTDKRVADLKEGMTIDRFGYSVRLPWSKTKVIKDFKIMTTFGFEDGSSMLVFDPAARVDMLGPNLEIPKDTRDAYATLIGMEAASSHYGYAKQELNESPKDVSLFNLRRQNARAMILMPLKSIDVPEGTSVIYETSSGLVKGFQFGDSRTVPTSVELLLFDGHDRALKLIFKGSKGGTTPVLTQAQLNAIVASIQTPN